jgi:hypothetical protein
MARLMRATVSGATTSGALSARETVATETPACFATTMKLMIFQEKREKKDCKIYFFFFSIPRIASIHSKNVPKTFWGFLVTIFQ